ncbi:MAG: polyphosphate kinase [Actinomycetota bacterium]|nr:polyphosphate kinase [Actinomycetota bacterium]
MFVHTDAVDAPWTVITSDRKKRPQLNAIRYVLHKLPHTGKEIDQIGPLAIPFLSGAYDVYESL